MKALCFGSLNIDHTYRLHRFLQPGETNHALSFDILPGGKGLNQAIALARAGGEVYMGGCVGADGQSLSAFLQKNGVHTDYLKIVSEPTGHTVIQVEDSGENCILVYPGANYALSKEQISDTLQHFDAGDLLIVQNETNLVGTILTMAKERGMITVLNPSPMRATLRNEIPFMAVDWLILNRAELTTLAENEVPQDAVAAIQAQYPDCKLVVTLGGDGAFYCDNERTVRQKAYQVQAIDTTGAGDTFTGYFLESYQQTQDPAKSLARASAAAAIAVTRHGAADSIPTAEETDKFMKNQIL